MAIERYGLLGSKIGYSQSPQIFRRLWQGDPTPRVYQLVDTPEPEQFLAEVRSSSEWKGFSVTIPYKEWVIPYLDRLTSVAQAVGAVNAVRVDQGHLIGHNTDVSGFLAPLDELDYFSQSRRALVLGTGGASKAVVYALKSKGVEVQTVSRSRERGQLLYEDVSASMLQEVDLIVNATPLGSQQFPHSAPPIPYAYLGAKHFLYDLTYTEGSGFLAHAPADCPTLNGFPMLQAQALSAHHFFNGEDENTN